jgi:hypothetical protein
MYSKVWNNVYLWNLLIVLNVSRETIIASVLVGFSVGNKEEKFFNSSFVGLAISSSVVTMFANALSFHNNKSWYEPADKTKGFIRALTIMVFAFASDVLVSFF